MGLDARIDRCKKCGDCFFKKGRQHVYCAQCSNDVTAERQRKWASAHPQPADVVKAREERRRKLQALVGQARSLESRSTIDWRKPDGNLLWHLRVAIPFTYSLSKNAIWRMRGKGHVYLREDAKIARESIEKVFRKAIAESGRRVAQNKLWVDMLVQKSDQKGDASNFIDSVFDGLKKGIGLDDRWYSISRLDWEIVKVEPKIFIGIGQSSTADVQACSICGALLPFSSFGKNKSNKSGVNRACVGCRRLDRKMPVPDAQAEMVL